MTGTQALPSEPTRLPSEQRSAEASESSSAAADVASDITAEPTDAAVASDDPPGPGSDDTAASLDTVLADSTAPLLTRGDMAVATLLGVVLVILLGLHAGRLSGWGARPILVEYAPRDVLVRLNINEANWVELAQLEAVGEVLARRIVEDRSERGPFGTVDDLRRLKGIGARTLEKLRPLVRVDNPSDHPRAERTSAPASSLAPQSR
ncbi:MAG: helix-hairpin-helix domain-containing protein [Planctomycetaceae bacterium]|nr:helix-hairpin-helix domain-containing protein [Planctomycetaceae bacterium]